MIDGNTLLSIRNLRTYFRTDDGLVKAVDDVSFRIGRKQTFALVGESGCGKSVTAFSILRLLPMPPAFITSAGYLAKHAGASDLPDLWRRFPSRIELEGRDLLDLPEHELRQVRGGRIGMIFQEPMSSLNPVFTCGSQIVEAIRLHRGASAHQAKALAIDLLDKVGIPGAAQRFGEYPHRLSGGMRQRVMIAMALSCEPELLIADEPTTALDVTIQAQILDLLRQLQGRQNLSIMLITHDLAVVAEMADVVGVMYASKIVELAGAQNLFGEPLHPYTQALFRSLPRLGQKRQRLATIPGAVPNPLHFPTGCKFHPRCDLTRKLAGSTGAGEIPAAEAEERLMRRCVLEEPPLREVRPGCWCACWFCPGYDAAPQTDPSEGNTETAQRDCTR